jgi:hypothetical protein
MQNYVYKDGKILQDITDDIKQQYPKITITETIYSDATEEFTTKVKQLYEQVESKIRKKNEFNSLVAQYQYEIDKIDNDVNSAIEQSKLDKELVKIIDPERATLMGL